MTDTQITENGIYYRNWPVTPGSDPKAVVLLVHGLGEHCERYTALAVALNNANYALCSMDLPGHGQSAGERGHIDRFSDFQTAVLSLHAKIKQWYPDKPVFLLGHSMGGLISTHLLLDKQDLFKGALLSGAAIQSPQTPPAWQLAIMRGIASIVPKFGALTLDASGISRDAAVVDDYMNDPLVNKGKLSARLLIEMFGTMDECKQRATEINIPIRIMHGGGDVMTSPEGSQLLYDQVSSKDKELEIYSGLYHEIFNEPEAQDIYQQVVSWLDNH